jgi:CheY-like chemotaxis protein
MSVLIHALAVTRSGGTLSIQTSRVNAGAGDSAGLGFGSSFAALTVTYSAIEPDVERLFNPSNTGNGFTLAVAQSIVTEQGGVLTAGALESGTEIQMLLPVVEESVSNGLGAEAIRTILLVEARALVRTHLHNVAESAGYNLLEATDAAEAIGLCELQDAPVDLLIASPEDALRTTSGLSKAHAPRMVLRIVGRTEQGVDELQQPFTQKAFLDRIGALAKVMAEPGDAQAAAN